jgi:hypothetical protein
MAVVRRSGRKWKLENRRPHLPRWESGKGGEWGTAMELKPAMASSEASDGGHSGSIAPLHYRVRSYASGGEESVQY